MGGAHLVAPLPLKTLTLASNPQSNPLSTIAHTSGNSNGAILRKPKALAPQPRTNSFDDLSLHDVLDRGSEIEYESDEDRELYQEAEEDFRELIGCCFAHNTLYRFPGACDATPASRHLTDSSEDLLALDNDAELVDLNGLPRLGHSPVPDYESSRAINSVPERAPNPMIKNDNFAFDTVATSSPLLRASADRVFTNTFETNFSDVDTQTPVYRFATPPPMPVYKRSRTEPVLEHHQKHWEPEVSCY
eukprot:TRINITY_DN2426_c0_g1_i2.p1 TRINITY_DN2426_c0_g1~~TRINITY_DN2426_c0_g1_i2.p1  ORF type:complete len:280 (+),score=38.82 TRINITY_DN2426_c0_g1_i2:100-840(+)